MITYLLIFALVYLLSVYLNWLYFHKVYSEIGVWNMLTPNTTDVFLTFTPIINSLFACAAWLFYYPINREFKSYDFSKFFKIKK